jgi:hypothetical protein
MSRGLLFVESSFAITARNHPAQNACYYRLAYAQHLAYGVVVDIADSRLLRRHGVQPYIWMTANLQSLFRRLRNE